MQQLVQLF